MTTTPDLSNPKFWLEPHFNETNRQILTPDQLQSHLTDKHFPENNQQDPVLDRIQGSIIGLALGDALGASVEFRPHEYMVDHQVKDMQAGGTWGLQAGQFTDDTSMSLCLANSLIAKQDFDPYDQLVRYKWWYRHGYMSSTGECFDIGTATRESIEEFEKRQRTYSATNKIPMDDMDTLKAADRNDFDVKCSRTGVAGNGALMRLSPVPLFFHKKPELAVEYSGLSGLITHGDQKSIDACRYYGALIVAALKGETREQLTDKQFYQKHKEWFGDKPLSEEVLQIAQGSYQNEKGYEGGIRGGGYVVRALEAALWAFWSDRGTFREGALKAVNLGDDTDTTAAIYGQLAGAHYGYKSLPSDWLDKLYAHKLLGCISRWTYHEGNEWFKKAARTALSRSTHTSREDDRPEGLYNSHFKESNMEQDRTATPSLLPQSVSLERHAIGTSARIGDLYDACRDQLVSSPSVRLQSTGSKEPNINYEILNGEQFRQRIPLEYLDIDPQQSLSILSGLVEKKGIAAVLDYPYLYNIHTHGFHYSFVLDEYADVKPIDEKMNISNRECTHIITGIEYGIDVVVVMTVEEELSGSIKSFLVELCKSLKHRNDFPKEITTYDQSVEVFAYSNSLDLNLRGKLSSICEKIRRIQKYPKDHKPCKYVLHPIRYIYTSIGEDKFKYAGLRRDVSNMLEKYWNFWSMVEKKNEELSKLAAKNLKEADLEGDHERVQKLLKEIYKNYFKKRDDVRGLIVKIRRGEQTFEALNDYSITEATIKKLHEEVEDAVQDIILIRKKLYFVRDMKKKGFEYCPAAKLNINRNDNIESISNKLLQYHDTRFLLSNQELNKLGSSQFKKFISKLEQEHLKNGVRLVYIDFTHSELQLDSMLILPMEDVAKKLDMKSKRRESICSVGQVRIEQRLENIPNVLLIGAEKSGKSMLINIIHNCELAESSLSDDKRIKQPKILIPFQYSVDLDEHSSHLITRGKHDPNERYSITSGSTTQQSKAYVAELSCGTKFRLIDTPGFSRKPEKQRMIVEQISDTVLEISSLKAVIVVIRSIDRELEGYSSFIQQLMNVYGVGIQNKLLFCFTEYLTDQPDKPKREAIRGFMKSIESLQCCRHSKRDWPVALFDSQFFHMNAHDWTRKDRDIFVKSQQISKDGLDIIKKFVMREEKIETVDDESKKQRALKTRIKQLVRPMLESIRNNFRNVIILSELPESKLIELCAVRLKQSSIVCYSCARPIQHCCGVWIVQDKPQVVESDDESCGCSSNSQEHVHYELRYKKVQNSNETIDQFHSTNNKLFKGMILFGKFLRQIGISGNGDWFVERMKLMMKEESWICETQKYVHSNEDLLKDLKELNVKYVKAMKDYDEKPTKEKLELELVAECISKMTNIELVRKQLDVIDILQTSTRVESN